MGRRETTAESQELPAQGVPAKQDGWRVEIKGPANEITVGKGVRKVAPGFPVKFSLLTNSRNRIREATSTFGGGVLRALDCAGFVARAGICQHK